MGPTIVRDRVRFRREVARSGAVLIVVLCVCAAGCGKGDGAALLRDVNGTVTYKGNPVGYGHVTLYPRNGPPAPAAILAEDGTFRTKARAGQYKVVVESIPPPEGARPDPLAEGGYDYSRAKPATSMIPLKYSRPETSDVEIEVSEETDNRFTISLR
jgi:hypothetical protein